MEFFKNNWVTFCLCQPPLTTETAVYRVDKLAKDYKSTLRMLIDCHAPLKSKTVKVLPSVPWYTAQIWAAKHLGEKWKGGGRKMADKKTFMLLKCKEIM